MQHEPLNLTLLAGTSQSSGNEFGFLLEREHESRYFDDVKDWYQHTLGTALCITSAGALVFIFRESPSKRFIPFLFIGVATFAAAKFGTASGIVGTVGAAIVFAEFLFEPVLSMQVSDSVQRNNLVWMIIAGIAVSELLGVQPKSPPPQQRV